MPSTERPFRIGDRVRISRDSGYYGTQPHRRGGLWNAVDGASIGVITEASGAYSINVHWPSLNYRNAYESCDLEHGESGTYVAFVALQEELRVVTIQTSDEMDSATICNRIRGEMSITPVPPIYLMSVDEVKALIGRQLDTLESMQRNVFDLVIGRTS